MSRSACCSRSLDTCREFIVRPRPVPLVGFRSRRVFLVLRGLRRSSSSGGSPLPRSAPACSGLIGACLIGAPVSPARLGGASGVPWPARSLRFPVLRQLDGASRAGADRRAWPLGIRGGGGSRPARLAPGNEVGRAICGLLRAPFSSSATPEGASTRLLPPLRGDPYAPSSERSTPLPSLSGPARERAPPPTNGHPSKAPPRARGVVRERRAVVGTAVRARIEGSGWGAGTDTVVTTPATLGEQAETDNHLHPGAAPSRTLSARPDQGFSTRATTSPSCFGGPGSRPAGRSRSPGPGPQARRSPPPILPAYPLTVRSRRPPGRIGPNHRW